MIAGKRAAVLFLAIAILGAHALDRVLTSGPGGNPRCSEYFGAACSEALGAWLPAYIDGFDPWRKGKATQIAFVDGFVYEGHSPHAGLSINQGGGPVDGTFFVYGSAGPPKGMVVYDYRHRIAFYEQGCCAWESTVAASNISTPPKRVADRDLKMLRTRSGIVLGDPPARITHVYGRAHLWPLYKRANLQMLNYYHMYNASCGQFQNFFFKGGRLVLIELLHGC